MGSITKEEKLRREKLAEQGVKVCSQCKRELPFTHFSKDKTKKDGYRCYCNDCAKEHRKIYYENNQKNNEEYKAERKIYLSNYYKENKDKLDAQHKEYYKENKDVIQKQHKQYAELHKEEIALYKAEYYELNKEQIKDKKHRYYIKNYDHFSEKNKKYRLEHASEIMKYDKQYRSTEHGKIMRKKHKHTRRAIEKNADGQYSAEDVKDLILFFDNKCAYTGEPLEDKYHLDHVVALKNGGTNYIWNIVPCNRNPNLSKGSKDMEQWFRKQEYFSGDRLQKIYEWINTKQKEIGGAKNNESEYMEETA